LFEFTLTEVTEVSRFWNKPGKVSGLLKSLAMIPNTRSTRFKKKIITLLLLLVYYFLLDRP